MRNLLLRNYVLFQKCRIFSVKQCEFYQIMDHRYCLGTLTGDKPSWIDDNTLQSRFVAYMKDSLIQQSYLINRNTDIKKCNKLGYIELGNVTNINLYDIICSVSHPDIVQTKMEFVTLLSKLDQECVDRMHKLTINELLLFLNAFIHVYPHRMLELKFYKYSLQRLCSNLNCGTKLQLIQLCFYASLQKKRKKANHIITQCLNLIVQNYLNYLTCNDVCIICNATFKTSTKINNEEILEKVVDTLYNNLSILKDPALFITIVKSIRQNRFQNEDLLLTISNVIFFNKTISLYSFTANCHLLALYADALYYDENLLNLIINKCIEQIKYSVYSGNSQKYFMHQIRGKDIARFLWATSFLGYRLDLSSIKEVIIPSLEERFMKEEFKNDIETLVDSILCLWILNYQPIEIIHNIITYETVQQIKESKLSRCKLRLNLLLISILLENRQLFNTLKVKFNYSFTYDLKYQLSKRNMLHRIYEILKDLNGKYEINRFELHTQIPYLEIVGITGYKNTIDKAVFIEVIDKYVCITNKENLPNGLMQLKLRLLKTFNCPLVTVYEEEMNDLSNKEIKEHLEEEIFLACC